MHTVAQQLRSTSSTAAAGQAPGSTSSTSSVCFGVMDVDVAPEGGAVSSALGLQQLPTYVIYSQGVEVARLSSSPDRRRLGEVLGQLLAPAKQH
jgi:thioredoxin-like negative regulator of GroEL